MSEPINGLYNNTLDSIIDNFHSTTSNSTSLDTLYNIISQKDELIQNLKETNDGLGKIINNFNSNIEKTNKKVSHVLSQISTAQDIDRIMINEKNRVVIIFKIF